MKIITFELAQKLKHVGYDIPCQNRYDKNGVLNKTGSIRYGEPIDWNNNCFNDGYRNYCSAPTYDELFDWFLLTFKIFAYIKPYHNGGYIGILKFANNIWFDRHEENFYFLRDVLYMETLKMIEKEFRTEVLLINTFQIEPGNILLFSNKYNINMFCFREGDEQNFIRFHFMNSEFPQPEVYMDIILNKIKNNIFVNEPSVNLYKLLDQKDFSFDKEYHIKNGLKPSNPNTKLKIDILNKKFYYGPFKINENIESNLSDEDTIILIERLNFKNKIYG